MNFEREENEKCVLLKAAPADEEFAREISGEIERIRRKDALKPVIIGIGKEDFEVHAALLKEALKTTGGRVALAVADDLEEMNLESLLKAQDAAVEEISRPLEIKPLPELADIHVILKSEREAEKKRAKPHNPSKISGKFNSKGFSNSRRFNSKRGGR